jgi:hypothetical protein
MTLTKAQARARAEDRPWGDGEITKVRRQRGGFSIETNGSGFWLSREQLGTEKAPKVGDQIATYTHHGSMMRGVDLRGTPLYYKTDAELEVEHEQWVEDRKEKQRKEFEKNRRKLDRQFAALPDVFQRRISWFRAWNPDFRWENEAYELSCCTDAVKISAAMKTPKGVVRFQKMSYKKQRELVPDLYDGHSGNSFGMACRLAWVYLENPLLVIAEHGALTPLVGCEQYGCMHPRPSDVMEVLGGETA